MGKSKPSYTVGGNVSWYSHYGEQYEDALKNRNKSTIWPRNPTTGLIPWENHNWKRHVYPSVHCNTFIVARTWKQLVCPLTDTCIKKMWYIYTMEYTQPQKNKFKSVLVRYINLESVIQSEICQKEKSIVY